MRLRLSAVPQSAKDNDMPLRSNLAEPSYILEVINDVFARHRDGTLSDIGGRRALLAFITAHPAAGHLTPETTADLDTYLDEALHISRKATSSYDADTQTCARVIMGIAIGDAVALRTVRRMTKTSAKDKMAVDCV